MRIKGRKYGNELISVIIFILLLLLIFFITPQFIGEKIYEVILKNNQIVKYIKTSGVEKFKSCINILYWPMCLFAYIIAFLFIYEKVQKSLKYYKLKKSKYEILKDVLINTLKSLYHIFKSIVTYIVAIITIIYTYGKASTDSKLATLHGAILDNATLAILGGGTLEEGGGGMELGYKVLFLILFYIVMMNYIKNNFIKIVKLAKNEWKKLQLNQKAA